MRLSLVPPRSHEPEILDRPGNAYDDLARALRDISRVNRWLGGTGSVWRPLRAILDARGLRSFSVLDVGTGGADVPRAIVASAARRGLDARAAGLDRDRLVVRFARQQLRPGAAATARAATNQPRRQRAARWIDSGDDSAGAQRATNPTAAALPTAATQAAAAQPAAVLSGPAPARAAQVAHCAENDGGPAPASGRSTQGSAPRLALVQGDAFRLPFRDLAFDFVTCSMMFHHFPEDDARALLSEMARVARRAVIVSDLARHLVPWALIRLLARVFSGSAMFRNDAPLSVLRGWTAAELSAVASAAGLGGSARIERRFPYRLVLIVERTDDAGVEHDASDATVEHAATAARAGHGASDARVARAASDAKAGHGASDARVARAASDAKAGHGASDARVVRAASDAKAGRGPSDARVARAASDPEVVPGGRSDMCAAQAGPEARAQHASSAADIARAASYAMDESGNTVERAAPAASVSRPASRPGVAPGGGSDMNAVNGEPAARAGRGGPDRPRPVLLAPARAVPDARP